MSDMSEIRVHERRRIVFPARLHVHNHIENVVGLDLSSNDSFVMPVRQEVQIFEDDTLHRQKRAGMYGWAEHGFAVLDNRRVLLGAF